MKKLLEENITILTHIVGFAGPASWLPMEYALRIPIPEFGYSYVEKRFYPPITDGKSLLSYENTFIRYPVQCDESHKKYDQAESREYGPGRTLQYVKYSVHDTLDILPEEREFIAIAGDVPRFVSDDPTSSLFPQPGARIIDSYTIERNLSSTATHFIYAAVIPVRDILPLFRKKMKQHFHRDQGSRYDSDDDRYFWQCLYENCELCPGCKKRKMNRLKEELLVYHADIINFQMRRAIVENMHYPPLSSIYYTSPSLAAKAFDRTFRLRHWYWQISCCDDELLNQGYGSHSRIGYIDNEGILTLDELLWKMKRYDNLKEFFIFRKAFRESKKKEENLVAEFFETDHEDVDDGIESWWMMHAGVYTAKDVKVHGAHCIYEALGYDRYEEAAAMFHALDFRYEGEGEYEDLCERLGIFVYG